MLRQQSSSKKLGRGVQATVHAAPLAPSSRASRRSSAIAGPFQRRHAGFEFGCFQRAPEAFH
jgi:hypothetical protein